MSVEVLCEKSFSEVDEEIIDVLVEFHEAMIGGDVSRLNEIISDDFELSGMFAQKQSKGDFVSMVEDGTLDLSKSDIMDPTILWDDENAFLIFSFIVSFRYFSILILSIPPSHDAWAHERPPLLFQDFINPF